MNCLRQVLTKAKQVDQAGARKASRLGMERGGAGECVRSSGRLEGWGGDVSVCFALLGGGEEVMR